MFWSFYLAKSIFALFSFLYKTLQNQKAALYARAA
jgi:hypothetical protein